MQTTGHFRMAESTYASAGKDGACVAHTSSTPCAAMGGACFPPEELNTRGR